MLASSSLVLSDDEGVRTYLCKFQGSFIRHGISKEHCKAEIIFQILAGSDTTAHAVRATMLNIMTCARVYTRLQAEIDAAILDGRIKCNPASAEEVKELPYLQGSPHPSCRGNPPTPAGTDYCDINRLFSAKGYDLAHQLLL
jgi:hypothetical protein